MAISFQQHTLPNGLSIVAEIDDSAHTAAAGFFVKTGARDEAPEVMGVSHFLEHMMFKGTQELSAEELNRRFDAMGARNNAYTSNELTCFYAHVLPEYVPDTIDLLGRMMRPALRETDFATEKGVILEEIAMYADQPFWQLYEATVDRHFRGHPLGHRVLGTKESITRLTATQMRAYFESRYSADNTVVALTGRVDFDKACAQVERLCGWWRATEVTRDTREPASGAGRFELSSEKVSRGYALGLCRGPSYDDERRYAAAILAQVLGAPNNSRLHWALVETGLAEEAQASFDPHDGTGQFFVFAACDPHNLGEVWAIVEAQLATLRDSLTQADIDRLLAKFVTGTTVAGERPHDRMHRLGRQQVYLRRYRTLEEELDRLSRVTIRELREVCEAFPLQLQTVGRLVAGEGASGSTAGGADVAALSQ